VYYSGGSVSSTPTALPSTAAPSTKSKSTPTKVPSSDEDTLSGGAIAGIVIGSVAFVAIVVAGVAYYFLVIQPAATTAGTTAYTAAPTAENEEYAFRSPVHSPLVVGHNLMH
jgi:hypothetical protein